MDVTSSSSPQTADFCLGLMQQLYKPEQNLVISPYSLVSALIMLVMGSAGNSQLQLLKTIFDKQLSAISAEASKQLVSAFTSANRQMLEKNDKTLAIGNFLYSSVDFPLHPEYVDSLTSQLSAIAKTLNFTEEGGAKAVKIINEDVAKTTRGMISQLLDSLSPITRLVLVNAVYFKGAWEHPFKKEATKEAATFHLSGSSGKEQKKTVQVAMMAQERSWPYFEDYEATGCKAVLLDYNAGNIGLLLVLPKEGVTLGHFIKNQLTGQLLTSAIRGAYGQGKVRLAVPRFKLTGHHQLAASLRALGLEDVFTRGVANLSGISPNYGELSVSEVIQQAVIEVNEEGTTAAAGTALLLLGSSRFPPKPKEFIADRPFLYALVTKDSHQVLFIGAVEDPSKAK